MLSKIRNWISGEKALNEVVVLVTQDGFAPSLQFSIENTRLTELLEISSWSYACISANARAAASLKWEAQTPDGEDRWTRDRRHPLNGVLRNPTGRFRPLNDRPPLSWSDLIEITIQHLHIDGNAYWLPTLVDGGRTIGAIDLINPDEIKPLYSTSNRINGWLITRGDRTVQIPRTAIVHMQNSSPGSTQCGHSDLRAALRPVTIDRTAQDRIKANLENKIQPGLIMKIKNAAGLSTKQRDDLQSYLRTNYAQTSQDGTPLVIGADVDIVASPGTTAQIRYDEIRARAKDEIRAIFGTPPAVLADFNAGTQGNYAESIRSWWNHVLIPILNTIGDALNRQLIEPVYGDDAQLWYSLEGSQIGLILLDQAIDVAVKLVRDLGYSANVASVRVGLNMPYHEELDRTNVAFTIAGREDDTQ